MPVMRAIDESVMAAISASCDGSGLRLGPARQDGERQQRAPGQQDVIRWHVQEHCGRAADESQSTGTIARSGGIPPREYTTESYRGMNRSSNRGSRHPQPYGRIARQISSAQESMSDHWRLSPAWPPRALK